jgi:hypothetical protein
MYDFRYKNNKDFYKIPLEKLKDAIKNCKNVIKEFKKDNTELVGGKKYIFDIRKDNTELVGGKKYIFDIRKLDMQITKMFSKMNENVMWNLYRKPTDAFFCGRKITNKKLNSEAIHGSFHNRTLIVPVHRYSEYMENINLGYNPTSYKKLFNILYKFYNKDKLTLDDLNKIPKDYDGYKDDAIENINQNKIVKRIDIMGHLNRFEDIREISNNIFLLILGS